MGDELGSKIGVKFTNNLSAAFHMTFCSFSGECKKGVVHKWRHGIFDNFWPPPLSPSSRILVKGFSAVVTKPLIPPSPLGRDVIYGQPLCKPQLFGCIFSLIVFWWIWNFLRLHALHYLPKSVTLGKNLTLIFMSNFLAKCWRVAFSDFALLIKLFAYLNHAPNF